MTSKHSLKLAAIAIFSCLLVSCQNASDESRLKKEKPEYLLVLKTLDNPFFISIQEGFESGISESGSVTTRAGKNESDVFGQQRILKAYAGNLTTQNNLKGVVISPSSSGNELISDIAEFRKKGVPVILVDTLIPSQSFVDIQSNYNASIQSDNLSGGKLAAELLFSKLEKGKTQYTILVLEGAIGSDTAKQRRKGFEEKFSEISKTKNIETNFIFRSGAWRRERAQTITSAFVSSGEKIDGIFGANDEMALGAYQAYHSTESTVPPIVGFDAIDEAITATNEGKLVGTIAQDPTKMGALAAELLLSDTISELKFKAEKVNLLVCSPDCN